MDIEHQIDSLRDRAEDLPASEEILEFSNRMFLQSSDFTDVRHRKLLGNIVRTEEGAVEDDIGSVADTLTDREVAEDLVRWIHRTYDNEESNRDYRLALRVFGREVAGDDLETDDNGIPTTLSWISTTYSSNYDPTPEPRNMLRWGSDVQEMLNAAANTRDAAAIALAFDAGPRGSEFTDIRVGDITDHKHGMQVTVDGKRGQRTITLIPSVPYVSKWLGEHPRGNDRDALLWCGLTTGDELSYKMKTKMLSTPAERAGVDKPVTITNFRKSSAAHLASKGMNQAHLEDHHGWVRGSDAAARYISVFAEESDLELARVYGREVEAGDDEEIAPVECPRCGEDTPREKSLCVWCGQALEPGAAQRAEAIDDLLVEQVAAAEPEEAEKILEFRDQVSSDPEARARAVDRMLDGDAT